MMRTPSLVLPLLRLSDVPEVCRYGNPKSLGERSVDTVDPWNGTPLVDMAR